MAESYPRTFRGGALFIDASQVLARLPVILEEMRQRAIQGTAEICLQLFNDSVMQEPTVPKDTGHLRASGSVLVEGKAVYVSEEPSSGLAGTPVLEDDSLRKAGMVTGAVIFNTPYAAHLHETADLHFHEPGSGAKYLEAKVQRYHTQYAQHLANKIKGG